MTERSMYAKQEDDESGLGRGGANAVGSPTSSLISS
jgi:hypothetical protein